MYHDHFGLQDSPFTIAPDPRFLYMSDRHREALAHLLFGVGQDGGFVLLTGEVGTGKTTICRCLLEQLPERTQVACILNPRLSVPELLATMCDELRLPYPPGNASVKVFIDLLNAFLLESHAAGRTTVLIIDEAQNLSIEVLEQVRLLTNLETSRRKLLQIILLGQPELRDKLARSELRQLRQRITASYHLQPLNRRETSDYVVHRLGVAGLSRPVFTPGAIRRIHSLSGGIPRRINLICDRALLGAFSKGVVQVGAGLIDRAATEFRLGAHPPFSRRILLAAAIMSLLALGGFAFGSRVLDRNPVPGAAKVATVETAEEAATVEPAGTIMPAEAPFQWPSGMSFEESREKAYFALLGAWGLDYRPSQHGSACDFAEAHGLACLFRHGSLGSLRLLDRPAVLTLHDDRGEPFLATLTALPQDQPDAAVLSLNGSEVRAPLRELERRWYGEYTLLWRKPPFDDLLRPGDRGPGVDWLARRLAEAAGHPPPSRSGSVLEGVLLERLKAFQVSRGLEADGLVGPTTLIHLDSVLGGGSPRLASTGGT